MARYELVEENAEKVGEFGGTSVIRPKFRCKKCSRAIKEGFTHTSEVCNLCNNGENPVGEELDRIFAVSIYVPDADDDDLVKAILDAKDGDRHEMMSDLLSWGIENDDALNQSDLITVPPSGSADVDDENNHMASIGELLSSKVEIPFECLLTKDEEYESQTGLSGEERKENIKGSMKTKKRVDVDRVLVIDDVATTGSTLAEAARALSAAGAEEIKGLVIARDEDLTNLEFADVVRQVD